MGVYRDIEKKYAWIKYQVVKNLHAIDISYKRKSLKVLVN